LKYFTPHPKSFSSSSAFGIFSKGKEKWMQSLGEGLASAQGLPSPQERGWG